VSSLRPVSGTAAEVRALLEDWEAAADPAPLVVETSGSTGRPKRVVLSRAALRASADATHRWLGGPGQWLLNLPPVYVAGLQVLFRSLRAGVGPAEQHGSLAAAVAAMTGPRRYVSLVPTQLVRALRDPAETRALSRFDAVLVGGGPLAAVVRREAESAGVRIVQTYGMSETCGGCVYDGVPLDGVGVRLAEPDGRIWLAGPTLARGYLGAAEQTAEAFVDGWFRTSDLGEWVDPPSARSGPPGGARLRVLGRADDVITTGGVKVHPSAVERVLAAQPGVRAACVVGLPDPEWGQRVVAAVVVEHGAPDERGLGASVRAALGPASVPKLIRALPELPLRGVGKPDRAEVARLLDA
jgi:O-succinylbenzoic acid--CoA ligase